MRNSKQLQGKELEKAFLGFLKKARPPQDYEATLLRDHYKRVEFILDGGNPPPYELEIQPSGRCNLKCKHCWGFTLPRLEDKLEEEDISRIAQEISDYKVQGFGVETIKFCGTTGDPLVSPLTTKAIEIFKDTGKKIIVFTNGLWLYKRDEQERRYYESVLEADRLNLSIDSGSEEVFQNVKQREGFDIITLCLEQMVRQRKQRKSNLRITASYVIGKQNFEDIFRMAKRMKEIGIEEVKFRIDFTDREKIERAFPKIQEGLNLAKSIETPEFQVDSVYSPEEIKGAEGLAFNSYGVDCFNSAFWACIGPDANLYSCGHRTHGGVRSFGDLRENSFQELWESQIRAKEIKKLPDESCSICSPSSVRRNRFMGFLSKIPKKERKELIDRFQDFI